MTTYYVGPGGSDAANGLTWANRKLTLNGAEDIPVAAGDTVYVGPGTYREVLTVDVSGSAGNPITYIGDYLGTNTDGVGGVVRITGSDNDQTAARSNWITTGTARDYRTFQGFVFDTQSSLGINNGSGAINSDNWIIKQCLFAYANSSQFSVRFNGDGSNHLVDSCIFMDRSGILIENSATVNNRGHVVQNCIFLSTSRGIRIDRVGGITVKNCTFLNHGTAGVVVATALAAGQTVTVNNCVFAGANTAVSATATGEITENYNTFWSNNTDRTNTSTGANSVAYPPLFDPRWLLQLLFAGAGPSAAKQVLSPFDLASYSQLVNVAGTSPTTTDLRGTAVQGAQREWGALEYDSTLQIMAKLGSYVGAGMVHS